MSKSQFRSQLKCFADIDDEDIESIPDSLDSDFFGLTTRAETVSTEDVDKTEVVSTVLDGLESTRNDDSNSINMTEEDESIFSGQQSLYNKTTRAQMDSKSCQNSQHLSSIGVQTNDNPKPKTVLQSVSIQCSVFQTDQNVQTDNTVDNTVAVADVVTNQSSDNCQSNNCCFHRFVESIPCNSMKTFLTNLIEIALKKEDIDEKKFKTDTSVAVPTLPLAIPPPLPEAIPAVPPIEENVSSVQPIQDVIEEEEENDWPISEEQLSYLRLTKVNTSAKSSSSASNSLPKEEQISRKDSTAEKEAIEPKITSKQNKNNKKTEKIIESNNEIEEIVVTYEDVVNIGSSTSGTQVSEQKEVLAPIPKPKEVLAPIPKPKQRVRGPKSRQKPVPETVRESPKKRESSEEPKAKRKVSKVYVSSSDEEVDEIQTKDFQKEDEEKSYRKPTFSQLFPPKVKTYSKPNKGKNTKAAEKSNDVEVTDEVSFTKNIVQSTSTAKKQTAKTTGSKKPSKADLTEESKIDSIYEFSDEEKDKPVVTSEAKQKSKRKSVPKKKIPTKYAVSEPEEEEKKEKKTKKSKKQVSDTEEKNDSEENEPKIKKYKPKPKSKQKAVLAVRETNEETFKRPPSPTPSMLSNSSTSSRQRGSSTDRSKKVILFSGLDDKQRKKIEKVCRELDAEAVSDWSEKVTHLVIALATERPKDDMICPRNAKYIKTLLSNKWIVSYDWINDSSRSGRWIDETKYEIKADKMATERGLPQISRCSGKKLFAKQMFKFDDKIGAILSEFKDFVRIGGGIVVNSEDEFIRKRSKSGIKRLIVVHEIITIPGTQREGFKYINQKTFMTAISNFVEI